jgi:hypothetical protein
MTREKRDQSSSQDEDASHSWQESRRKLVVASIEDALGKGDMYFHPRTGVRLCTVGEVLSCLDDLGEVRKLAA